MFYINTHKNDGGSPAERFFRRGPRTCLPNSITRELDHVDLIKTRHAAQERLARSRGHTSRDQFKVGDVVVLQDPVSKKWKARGTVFEARRADDGTHHSFVISLMEGGETLRHKRHLRHDVANSTIPRRVQFDLRSTDPASTGMVTRSKKTSVPQSA